MTKSEVSIAALAAVLAAAVTGCAGTSTPSFSAPTVPAEIAVPAGHRVAGMLVGEGMLTYECLAGSAGAPVPFAWSPPTPEALLKEKNGTIVGKYYSGPTWDFNDGSKISGKQLAASPSTTGIPLQLIEASPASGNGVLVGVSYVQRVNTVGGAPSGTCDASNVGAKQVVKYSADYYFYKPS